jgi:hypothetical protein
VFIDIISSPFYTVSESWVEFVRMIILLPKRPSVPIGALVFIFKSFLASSLIFMTTFTVLSFTIISSLTVPILIPENQILLPTRRPLTSLNFE